MSYNYLMSPLTVNGMTIKNRVMMTPMGTNFANPDGSISMEHQKYYELRAKGGTGLIVVENVCVDFPMGSNGTSQLRLDHDSFIPHLYELTETLHKWGSMVAVQINQAGSAARAQPVSASDIPCKTGSPKPRPMTKEEIYELVEKYGASAKRAQMAGFDAVEVHAGHSYLLNQFISPVTNNRSDCFGGSQENRIRFLKLVLKNVREQVGQCFPIMLRISSEEFVPGGLTLADTLEWLPLIDEYVDIYDVSAGLNDSMENMIDKGYHLDGWRSYMPRAVKKLLGKPVISTGNYRDPRIAEDVIAKGDSDIIGIGRGLIADPEWCNKVSSGREKEIRKCISCCIGCAGNRMGLNRPIRCTVNPAVQEGDIYKTKQIQKKCNVVVIGAGTAGLEAACTAAEIGCNVTIIEKEDHIGGRASYVANLPEKFRMRYFVEYLENRAKKLNNLKIILSEEANAKMVKKLNPDLIVCATGSKIITPPIPGLVDNLNSGNIITADGVVERLLDRSMSNIEGEKAVIIGGGATGLDIVECLANKGAKCTVVEMLSIIGKDLDPVSRSNIINIMRNKNVLQMTQTKLLEVQSTCFITDKGILPFDIGVICLGLCSYNPLFNEMRAIAKTISVGDALRAPRQIIDGVQEGRDIIKTIELMGYLK